MGVSHLGCKQVQTKKMSWQAYVDGQLLATKKVISGAITGHDGSTWAASAGFSCAAGEVSKLKTGFNAGDSAAQQQPKLAAGLVLGGKKYMYLSGDKTTMNFMLAPGQGKGGATVAKSNQSFIIGTYDD